MADIFTDSLGGMNVTRSSFNGAHLDSVRSSAAIEREKTFAQKLKEVQDKTDARLQTNPAEDKKLREVCHEMEAVFLNILLGKMRDTIPERTLFPMSSGEKMMQSMLDVELTRAMAQGSGIGLGEMLYRQLSRPVVLSSDIQGNK